MSRRRRGDGSGERGRFGHDRLSCLFASVLNLLDRVVVRPHAPAVNRRPAALLAPVLHNVVAGNPLVLDGVAAPEMLVALGLALERLRARREMPGAQLDPEANVASNVCPSSISISRLCSRHSEQPSVWQRHALRVQPDTAQWWVLGMSSQAAVCSRLKACERSAC